MMKRSAMRRLLLLIAGIVLGLPAGLGMPAPAGASVEAAPDSAVAV
ncbi:hypothetical protein [Arthrobacter mobilis]|uniref:Uncharacterized protein n=1 Tax=Arthrobacter mobilis TaxID=2724944 RepID=A0A7X6K505_9MICC|nr:hypothetical protein [Arthrobacter mobilis]NKX53679.1 hypothetical protein [Arthrobacter mobilis]